MNKELVETVAEAQFGEVWRMARNAGHGNSTEAMIIEEAEKAINLRRPPTLLAIIQERNQTL